METKGDLFYCSESESLAHCISADVAMGKGIAVIFKKKFGGVRELKNQGTARAFCMIQHSNILIYVKNQPTMNVHTFSRSYDYFLKYT